jgi:nucleotide-binding universal stress UspA family protein
MKESREHDAVFHKILLAYDGSPGSQRALQVAVRLADHVDAELHCICVEEKLPHYAATLGEVDEAKAERDAYFEALIRQARQTAWDLAGIELHCRVVAGHEVESVVTAAREGQFELLVVGFSGHSNIFGRVMGSTTQSLSRLSPCSILIVK